MLIDHLKIQHKITKDDDPNEKENRKRRRLDFDEDSDEGNDGRTTEKENTLQKEPKEKLSSKQKEIINKKLLNFIIKQNLSFNIVESDDFQEFIEAIRSDFYILPCRQTVRNSYLPKMVENVKKSLEKEISDVLFGSTTTDCWVSNSNNSYMVVTYHYISDQIEFKSRVLSLKYLDEDHDATYLSSSLIEVMVEWDTIDKTYAVISDSGSNIKLAVSLLNDEILKLPCSAHKINLCVSDLFKHKKIKIKIDKNNNEIYYVREYDKDGKCKDLEISKQRSDEIVNLNKIREDVLNKILGKCKKMVGSIRHSESLTRLLKNKQESCGLKYKIKLVQDVPTRWNSTFDMIDSILFKIKFTYLNDDNKSKIYKSRAKSFIKTLASKYLKPENNISSNTNRSSASHVHLSSSSIPEIIPFHQIPRIHAKFNENNFLNGLQDPVDKNIEETDQFLESLDHELDLYENRVFKFNENNNTIAHTTANSSRSLAEWFFSCLVNRLLANATGCATPFIRCTNTAPTFVADASQKSSNGLLKSGKWCFD
ncbi:unnamed protein product [Brachionus calyciflorus]|uniref:Uncharacterized protein n=1 Tax=Brachionus calyciflorus TaxID=104777 RepID=A0A814NSV9_9BILA|nr:unnamed protein product [Brachionus calyciflorus]